MSGKSSSALLWVIAIVIVVLGIVYFSKPAPKAPEEQAQPTAQATIPEGPIVLGAMDPLTGDGAVYGIPLQNATMLAVNEINAAGGIDGHQLQLVWEDSKCNPQDGSSAAQKLIEVDKIKFIVSGDCSGAALAAAALTEPAGVMLFSAAASSPDLSTAGDLVFRSYPSDAMAGDVIASYSIKKLGTKKVSVISEQTDYAQGLRKSFTAAAAEYGAEVVADETFNTGDTDFRTQVLKISTAAPDVLYIVPQTPAAGIQILKQLKENGFKGQLLVSDVMLGSDTIAKNKTLYADIYSPTPELDSTREVTKRFLDNFQAAYGHAPEYPASMAAAYDQIYMLKDAFPVSGVDPLKVRDWLYAVKNWPGALGDTSFDQNGDPIIGYHIKHFVNGETIDLGAYTP
ncbi:ABC transporter substrate-binding protein [Candidatus Uhrbacteria bacterium]|nr:ABC transporter substrate-binding protein [Candidatus Uhrbacteria bacterium]